LAQKSLPYLCPSWKRVNSASVGSRTVSRTQDKWSSDERGGSVPRRRTSLQPDRTLHMSMQSKYLKEVKGLTTDFT